MHEALDSTSTETAAPPPVRVIIPTSEPGPWFDTVLESLSDQDYPALAVTLVHGPNESRGLPYEIDDIAGLTSVEVADDLGFGAKVNQAAMMSEEPLLLIMHDDVALEPSSLSSLVREYLRRRETNTVVSPKLLDWNDPKQLMPAGFEADAFGMTTPLVRSGDFDQGQQDRVSELFGASTACLLINRDVFEAVGGFDEAMDWYGEAHDLALRVRSTGGSVVLVPTAKARHRGDMASRDAPNRVLRERRHQMRSVLAASKTSAIPGLLARFALLHIVEFVVSLVRLDLGDAASIVGSWIWNLIHLPGLLARRQQLVSAPDFNPDDVVFLRRRGSIRLSESIDRRITKREEAVDTEGAISSVRVAGGVVVAALLAFGARHLITRGIPAVGEFRALPTDLGELTRDWLTGYRTWGVGSEGHTSAALPLLDLLGLFTFGLEGLTRALLILVPIPLGVLGVWRLFANASVRHAPATAAAMYAASPLAYNAISNGSFRGIFLYAALPWIFANIVALSGSPVVGEPRDRVAATLALALLVGLTIAVVPFSLIIIGGVLLGLLIGSLLSGDVRGVIGIIAGTVIAAIIGAALNWPYLVGLTEWSAFSSAQPSRASDLPLLDLIALDTGPVGSAIFGWAFILPALLGLISGKGARFSWAMRVWGIVLVFWGLAWASERGVLPLGLPVLEVVLAPVALGIAVLTGLASMTIDVDLAQAKAWRFFPVAVAIVGFIIAMVPLVDASSSGRWELAQSDLNTTFGALESDPNDGSFRVVFIGDAHVLGAGAIPTSNDLAWASSFEGVPDVRALWRGPNSGATAELTDTIAAGLDGRTSRLGRELARFGVRFIVVVDQQAPLPEQSRREVVSDVRAAGLNAQLDLVRTGVVNPAVTVFRNTDWVPVHAAVPPTALETLRIADADPAVVERTGVVTFEGQTRVERDIYAAWEPSPRWTLVTGDGVRSVRDDAVDVGIPAARIDLGTVGIGFETSTSASTEAVFAYETATSHRLISYLVVLGWLVLFAVRRWAVGRSRRSARRDSNRLEQAL